MNCHLVLRVQALQVELQPGGPRLGASDTSPGRGSREDLAQRVQGLRREPGSWKGASVRRWRGPPEALTPTSCPNPDRRLPPRIQTLSTTQTPGHRPRLPPRPGPLTPTPPQSWREEDAAEGRSFARPGSGRRACPAGALSALCMERKRKGLRVRAGTSG